jgi:hypothetical protein
MQLMRIVNAFAAALFFVLVALSLAFLGAARGSFAGGGTAGAIGWAGLFALYALLAFLNMRGASEAPPSRRLLALNLAAVLPMLVGLVALGGADRFLCGASALPFALSAGLIGWRRGIA